MAELPTLTVGTRWWFRPAIEALAAASWASRFILGPVATDQWAMNAVEWLVERAVFVRAS